MSLKRLHMGYSRVVPFYDKLLFKRKLVKTSHSQPGMYSRKPSIIIFKLEDDTENRIFIDHPRNSQFF